MLIAHVPCKPHLLRHLPLLALVLPLSLAVGCRGPMLEPEPPSAFCDVPAAASMDPIYFALGALYEYAGYRADLLGDTICTFAATRGPEAVVFARDLERIADQNRIDTRIVVRAGEGGCTVVASQAMKEFLVSHYPSAVAVSNGVRFFQSSPALFGGRASKLSYLAGVYLRFKEGDTLRFANSGHKVRLVRELLVEMGCADVAVQVTPRGHYPAMFTVSYVPTPEIAALFAAVEEEREAASRQR